MTALVRDDPLEKEIVTHSSILAWEIPWSEEPGGLQSMRSHKSQDTLLPSTEHPSWFARPRDHFLHSLQSLRAG